MRPYKTKKKFAKSHVNPELSGITAILNPDLPLSVHHDTMVNKMGSAETNFKAQHQVVLPVKQQQHVDYHIEKIWFTALFSQSSSSSIKNGMKRKIKITSDT